MTLSIFFFALIFFKVSIQSDFYVVTYVYMVALIILILILLKPYIVFV